MAAGRRERVQLCFLVSGSTSEGLGAIRCVCGLRNAYGLIEATINVHCPHRSTESKDCELLCSKIIRRCDPKLHAPFPMGLEEGVW
jgi:hypothetical protein